MGGLSEKQKFDLLSPEEQEVFLAEMQPEDLPYLESWEFHGRPEQQEPEGNWKFWLCTAGRGFGKTRLGSEWVKKIVAKHRAEQARNKTLGAIRIALVARTSQDARETMIEGESGILSVYGQDEQPLWEPSKRQIVWTEGPRLIAIANVYYGEEPERCRGPNPNYAWADESCFVAGTVVETDSGPMPIERVVVGQRVWTRDGLRSVVNCGKTSDEADLFRLVLTDGTVLIGTANHPIWTRDGFKPLSNLEPGEELLSWTSWSGAAKDGTSTLVDTTTTGGESCCTGSSTNPCMDPYLPDGTFTTKTTTPATLTSPTSKHSLLRSTTSSTSHEGFGPGITTEEARSPLGTGSVGRQSKERASFVVLDTKAQASGLSTAAPDADVLIAGSTKPNGSPSSAPLVESHSERPINASNSALPNVGSQDERSLSLDPGKIGPRCASNAELLSCHRIPGQSAVRTPAPTNTVRVVGVSELGIRGQVYNLQVEGCPEYFANGVLVHNCSWKYLDATWANLMKMLRKPPAQCLITTTPKKLPWLKDLLANDRRLETGSRNVHVTEGSTFDNADNLDDSALEYMRAAYEGTTLGDQELYGRINWDEIPGALWTMQIIDDTRVREISPDRIRRKVVAIDPAATSKRKSDLTGIVAVAAGGAPEVNTVRQAVLLGQPHGYVLADRSGQYSPAAWARMALDLLYEIDGDCLVAEINQGGEMVEQCIRSVLRPGEQMPRLKLVHSKTGKRIRAEPVVTLYEQGRFHHVGVLADLESQLTSWVPTDGGPSPDRMDALVHGATELFPSLMSLGEVHGRVGGTITDWSGGFHGRVHLGGMNLNNLVRM